MVHASGAACRGQASLERPPSALSIPDGGFLGLPPTGRFVTMRVMDFYLHHEGLIRGNWLPIDLVDLLRQMCVDVFGRLRALLAGRGQSQGGDG
ncbi:ester cyclase [Rubellimicrobium sp. CFH 75288]|uniref:ester cyclase n=1 Tax=Rubellimicrobium sp. CFH 75288 TaxID=2697034 RepID=UPI00210F6E70|nr:ester cyclase [Rubellimicrobium sp. CFH 75288]